MGFKCDKCGFDEDAHIKHEQVKDAEIERVKLTFKVSDEAYKMLEDSQAMALSAFNAGWKCHTPCGDPEQSFDYWWQGILKRWMDSHPAKRHNFDKDEPAW